MAEIDIATERTIQRIIHRIVTTIDAGQASMASDHFTDDGILSFAGKAPYNSEFIGIENIRNFFQQRQDNKNLETRHLVNNICISKQQDGSYQADYMFNVLRGTPDNMAPAENLICDVIDQFRVDDGDLKIFHRSVTPIFAK